jgi:transposase
VAHQALSGADTVRREGRVIVFVDESGLSERPTRVRTWAPPGQTPVLQYSFSWKQLSAIAGLTFWNFYFRFFPGSIKAPQLVEFLSARTRQIEGKLLIVWDGLKAHKSRLLRRLIESQGSRIVLDYLPPYTPELNPVEYVWGYLKNREIANLCSASLHEVSDFARRRLKSTQRRPKLIAAF